MHQSPFHQRPFAPPSVQVSEHTRLHAALTLIESFAGEESLPPPSAEEERTAYARYCAAPSLVRRRYDALAGETAAFAAAGIAALLRGKDVDGADPVSAATRLAAEMRRAIAELNRLVAG